MPERGQEGGPGIPISANLDFDIYFNIPKLSVQSHPRQCPRVKVFSNVFAVNFDIIPYILTTQNPHPTLNL